MLCNSTNIYGAGLNNLRCSKFLHLKVSLDFDIYILLLKAQAYHL